MDKPPLIELRAVGKTYGAAVALKNIDLTINEGEFLVLLGPSGSGKTTILRIIGGFLQQSSGQLLMDGVSLAEVPVNRRPINTVFQDYALFPHLTVRQNVEYGLSVRGLPKVEIESRVAKVLDLVSLSAFAGRFPAQLSGGQRQRVALARAIVCEPKLILLDEPLAALDVSLRHQMHQFLKGIQRRINTTFLFITHDQNEAMRLADRICIMDHGEIVQGGTPQELYDRPQSRHVAEFFGTNNLISGQLIAKDQEIATIQSRLGVLKGRHALGDVALGAEVTLSIRPERIILMSVAQDGLSAIDGHIESRQYAGATEDLQFTPAKDPSKPLLITLLGGASQRVAGEGQCIAAWSHDDAWVIGP